MDFSTTKWTAPAEYFAATSATPFRREEWGTWREKCRHNALLLLQEAAGAESREEMIPNGPQMSSGSYHYFKLV